MPKQSLSQQLDSVVDALAANAEAKLPKIDPRIEPLVRIVAELNGLPRGSFKLRLKEELKRRATMTKSAVNPVREGFNTLTPYIVVNEAAELIDFVKEAFGAEELFRTIGGAGGIHCEVRIGDAMVMIGGGGEWKGTPEPGSFMYYVDDVDGAYETALKAGATSISEPVEQFYGDREAGVKDRFGNLWFISTKRPLDHNPSEMRTITPGMIVVGASKAIEFLKTVFGAEEAFRFDTPDGTLAHAKIKIGDSYISMGEAHGPFVQRPVMFYVYTPGVDAVYQRALAAGATSVSEPVDQPYGDRVAAVKDAFDVTWYIATHFSDGK